MVFLFLQYNKYIKVSKTKNLSGKSNGNWEHVHLEPVRTNTDQWEVREII